MSQILAFDVVINGKSVSIQTFDDLRRAVVAVNKELASTKINTPEFDRAKSSLDRLKIAQGRITDQFRQMSIGSRASAGELSTSFRQMESRIAVLREQYRNFTDAERKSPIGRSTIAEISKLDSQLSSLQGKLGNFKNSIAQTIKSQGNQLAGAVGGILTQQLGSQGGIAQSIIGGVGGGAISLLTGNVVLGVSQMAAGFAEAGAKAIAFNAEVSDALANVAKTTNLTTEELNKLTEDLKGLDTRTGLIDLLKIGEVLGQLGLEVNTASIAAVDKLNVALSDEFAGNTAEIVDDVGKLRNLFSDIKTQDQAQDFLRIGNALNYLGATGLATAPIISDFSVRIAGTVGPLGIAAKEILGVSAALQELGTNPERGASGFARSIRQLTQTPELFIKTLKLTGDTVERLTNGQYKSFTKLIQNDLFGAYKLVIERLKEMNLSNVVLSRTLDAVKISGVGEVEVIGKLIEGYDVMIDRVADAGRSLQNIDSITKEFTKKNVTLGAELNKLGNNIAELFVDSGFSSTIASWVGSLNSLFVASKDLGVELDKDNLALNQSVFSIVNLNQQNSQRIAVIRDLQKLYPEYLGNIDAEKVTNEQLLGLLYKVNNAYQGRLQSLGIYNDYLGKEDELDRRKKLTETARLSLVNELSEAYRKYGNKIGIVGLEEGKEIQNANAVLANLKTLGVEYGDLERSIQHYSNGLRAVGYQENLSLEAKNELSKALKFTNKELFETPKAIKAEADAQYKSNLVTLDKINLLVKQGKLSEAVLLKSKAEIESQKILNKLNTQAFKNSESIKGLGPQLLADDAKKAADRLRESTKSIQNSVKTIDGENVLTDRAKKVAISKKSFAKALENESDYYDARNKLITDSVALRTKAEVDAINDAKEKEIAAEDRRFAEAAERVKENTDKLVEIQTKAEEKIRATLSDIQDRKKQAVPGSADYKLLIQQESELNTQLADLQKQFLQDRDTISGEFNKNLEALTEVHNKNLVDIEEKYERIRLENLKRRQKALFDTLEAIRDKENTAISDKSAKLDAKIQQQREKAINAAKSTFIGDSLDKQLKKIDIEFDLKDFDNQKAELLQKIKLLEEEIKASGALNSAYESVGLLPVISQQDIDKLVDQRSKLTKKLVNVQQKEQSYIDKNDAEAQQKRLQKQKDYTNQLVNIFFDGLKKLNDAQAEIETKELERSINKRKALIDDEYKYRLDHAKNNTIETERLEKQKAARLEKLNEEQFNRQKEIDIKRAEIDAALSIIKAYATLDPISASIAAIGIGIETAILIDKIRSQKLAIGGFTGQSRYAKDSTGERPVNATVHEGEFVVRRTVVNDPMGRYYVNKLDRMNKGLSVNHARMFAEGGFISKVQTLADKNTIVYVNTTLSDDQLIRLADKITSANVKSIADAIVNGLDTSNRLKERNTELTNRTNL